MLASLAQLERSHRRHDDVMAGLLESARRLAAGRPDPDDVGRVHVAVELIARAATRHFLDLEGSVFPRLSTRRPALAPDLAALAAAHAAQLSLHGEIAAAAHQLDGEARPAAGMALLDAATRLADAHQAHTAKEGELFVAAAEALTPEDDAGIVNEMKTRRGRDEPVLERAPAKPKKSAKSKPAKAAAAKSKKSAKSKPRTKAPAAKSKAKSKPAAKSAKPHRR